MEALNMKKILFILSFVLLQVSVSAQKNMQKADSLFEFGDYARSTTLYQAQLAKSKSNAETCALLNHISDCLVRLGKPNEAISLLDSTIAICKDTLSLEKADLLNTKAEAYMSKGNYEAAQKYTEKALIIEERSVNNVVLKADCYNNLGLISWLNGSDEQALSYFDQALVLRKKKFGIRHASVAGIYNNRALVLANLQPDSALYAYTKALQVYCQIYPAVHPSIAVCYNNIGLVYAQKAVYDSALVNDQKALEIWEKLYPKEHPNQAFVYSCMSRTFLEKGDDLSAERFANGALGIYERNYGAKHPNVAACFVLKGTIQAMRSHYKEALTNFQKALIANVQEFNSADLTVNPTTKGYFDGSLLLSTLLQKAKAFENLHEKKTLALRDLRASLAIYKICDTLVDNLRHTRVNKADKLGLGKQAFEVYDNAVGVAIRLSEVTFKKNHYLAQAFYFSEKSKASVLQEAIADAQAKSFAGIPDEELSKEKTFNTEIATFEQSVAKGIKDPANLTKAQASLFALKRNYALFTTELEQKYPAYYNLKYSNKTLTVKDYRQKLAKGTALVEYLISDERDQVYVFVVNQKKLRVSVLDKSPDLDRNIIGIRNAVKFNSKDGFINTSNHLYKDLMPYCPRHIKQIVIVPDGRLSSLPFEMLLTQKVPENTEYSDMPYLLKKYRINYAYSGSLYLQSLQMNAGAKASVMLFAPVKFDASSGMSDLLGTAAEIHAIDSLFKTKGNTATVFQNDKASSSILKLESGKYALLHLATHGLVNEQNPELSCIFTSKIKADTVGKLYSGDIYNLNLKADLVTLSACQTALGKVSKGEGIIGLSRALIYAGANSIQVSLWNVSDASTKELMVRFYQYKLQEKSNPEALQLAKIDLVKSKEFAAPYYWAPFILIGK